MKGWQEAGRWGLRSFEGLWVCGSALSSGCFRHCASWLLRIARTLNAPLPRAQRAHCSVTTTTNMLIHSADQSMEADR